MIGYDTKKVVIYQESAFGTQGKGLSDLLSIDPFKWT